jgi:D-alanyl-D-alanine carboxypeptidase
MDFAKSAYIRGVNVQEKREIASLTKMYTLYSCLTLNKLLKINPETASIKIF